MSKARQLADLGYVSPLKSGTATYGGTADVITLTTDLNLSALTTGMEIRFRATAANTGATTINVDGIGAVTALTITDAALPASYIRTDVDTVIRYNGTNWIADRQVELGSNANGSYRREASGILECWHLFSNSDAIQNAMVGGFRTGTEAGTEWVFPVAYTATPITFGNSSEVASFNPVMIGATTIDVHPAFTAVTSQATATLTANVRAIGTWY